MVELDRAEVGVGPIYFCATAGASSNLCPTAVQEFAGAATIDGLDPTPREIGRVTGVTGEIRSATYDYAVTWLSTQSRPTATSGAPGGRSARFAGRATKGALKLSFSVEIDVVSRIRGERVVNGAPAVLSMSTPPAAGFGLLARVAPFEWFSRVDFDEIAPLADAAGRVVIGPETRAASALTAAMTADERLGLEWRQ